MERGTKRKLHKRDNKEGEEGPKRRKTERRKNERNTDGQAEKDEELVKIQNMRNAERETLKK
jgi:hypothetical protein